MAMTKVLIVEDDKPMAMLVQKYLKELGMEPTGAVSSGEEALSSIQDKEPDVILMDISIEGEVDGITLANQISSDHKIPIIFTSATSEDAIVEKLQKNKYPYQYACITKPVLKPVLKSKIEMALKVKKYLG